jgi:cold shock CspA family protein
MERFSDRAICSVDSPNVVSWAIASRRACSNRFFTTFIIALRLARVTGNTSFRYRIEPDSMMKSEIKEIRSSKRNDGSVYGFIAALDSGKDYYFATEDLVEDQPIDCGVKVEFDPVEESGNRKARNIRVLDSYVPHSWVSEVKRTKNRKSLPKTSNVSASIKNGTFPLKTFEELKSRVLEQVEVLSSITDPYVFEDGVFLLLRLLGIHTAYQYPRSEQAGEADGFFMIESFAVMYDCTLRKNFESYKKTQIENFRNRLSQSNQLTFEFRKPDGKVGSKTVPLPAKKQVWIITNGETRELEDFGGIKVKEIAVSELCQILERRLRDIAYDVDRLATDLMFIGNA